MSEKALVDERTTCTSHEAYRVKSSKCVRFASSNHSSTTCASYNQQLFSPLQQDQLALPHFLVIPSIAVPPENNDKQEILPSLPLMPLLTSTPIRNSKHTVTVSRTAETKVNTSVTYPSNTVKKTLKEDYECLRLYQSFLVKSLLSPRDAERFKWNTSANTFGGSGKNIPLDLDMEHSNRFVKQAIKNLGPNVNETGISRICHAERNMNKLRSNLDQSLHRMPGSGRQSLCNSIDNDLERLVDRAVSTDIFTKHENRQHKHFKDFERDQLKHLDMSSMYKWINYQKKKHFAGN